MDRKKEKITGSDKYYDLQMSLSTKSRATDILLIAVFLLFLFGFAIAGLILPDKEWSEQENRTLMQLPSMSSEYSGSFSEKIRNGKFLDRVANGKYMSDITKYLADQFPMRDAFVGVKSAFEISLGKRENNGVVLGKNGYLIDRDDYPSTENLERNLKSIKTFSEVMESRGIKTVFALAGKTEDVMLNELPSLYPVERREKLWNTVSEYVSGINYIDLRRTIIDSDSSNQLYYRTDHHWTTFGAYVGYEAVIGVFGAQPYPEDAFEIELVSDSFYGTTWSSAGMKWIKPDSMYYFRYDGDDKFVTTIDGEKSFCGFYDRVYLEGKDKYSSFLSSNNALVTIRQNDGQERQRLLIIKDSFSHSMAPFLARHYDLDLIDPRYYRQIIADYVNENDIDAVLILCNIDSLTSDVSYAVLSAGIG